MIICWNIKATFWQKAGFSWQLDNYLSWRDLTGNGKRRLFRWPFCPGGPQQLRLHYFLTAKDVVGYRGNRELVITIWSAGSGKVHCLNFCQYSGRQDYLHEYLKKAVEATVISDSDFTAPAGALYSAGDNQQRLELQKLKLVILAEKDIIGQQKVRFMPGAVPKARKFAASPTWKPVNWWYT